MRYAPRHLQRPYVPKHAAPLDTFASRLLLGGFVAAFLAGNLMPRATADNGAPPAAPASATAPSASPAYGDLTHLTFTATDDLHCVLLAPQPGGVSPTSSAAVEIGVGLGQGAELRVNGTLVPASQLGRRTIDAPNAQTRYTYYGVHLDPGPNVLEITPLGAGAARGPSVTATVFGPGAPARIEAHFSGRLVADGKTPLDLDIVARDRWNHPAAAGSSVKVGIVAGDLRFRDAASDGTAQTVEVSLVEGGAAHVAFLPGLRAGEAVVHLAGGEVETDNKVFLAPDVRAPFVVGVVSAGLGAIPSAPGEALDAPNGADSRRGRVALFAGGAIRPGVAATVAYDTADKLAPSGTHGPFQDDPSARPYATYGDASVRRADALSRDHLYARIDAGRSNATWGIFQAQTAPSDAAAGFNLLVDGAKVEAVAGVTKTTLFSAHNDTAYARNVFSPTGLATLGSALQPNIVVGSETVTLVALDRHTGIVINSTALTRNVDYTIDYDAGALRFIDVPLPFDANFNPQQILVQYEYGGAGAKAVTTGGRFEMLLGRERAVKVGLGYVNDAYGAGNLALFSQDAHGQFNGGDWSLSHVSSRGALAAQSLAGSVFGASGNAYRGSFRAARGADRVALTFESTSAGFDNPFGGLTTPGLLDYRFDYTHRFSDKRGEVSLGFSRQQNSGLGSFSAQTNAALRFKENLGRRLTLVAGLVSNASSSATFATILPGQQTAPAPGPTAAAASTTAGATTQAEVGFDWRALPNVAISLRRTTDLGAPSSSALPAQVNAQVNVDLPGKGKVYLRELWSAAPASAFAAATQSVASLPFTHALAVGFERPVGTATLASDYTVQRTANGLDVTSSMGVKERFELNKTLRGDLAFQRGSDSQSGGAFNLYNLALAYAAPDGRLRGDGAYQLRTGANGGVTFRGGAAGALTPALSLLASVDASRTNGSATANDRIGLAFRPQGSAGGAALLEFERTDGSAGGQSRNDVVAFESVLRPLRGFELATRVAYKLDGDDYYRVHSLLAGMRLRRRLGARLDAAVEASGLGVRGVDGASSHGLAFETGYRVGDAMRLAAGFNVSGAPDPALASAPARRGFYATITSVIDRVFGWGRNAP